MIIDAHIHLTPDGRWFNTNYDASAETALRQMDRAGIDMAAVIPMPGPEQREFVKLVVEKYSGRFVTGFTINSLSDKEHDELENWLREKTARFVKVHPRLTGLPPLDPGLDRFFASAEEAGVPVVFDTYIRGLEVPLAGLTPFAYDRLARRRPDLKIVLAHAGAHRVMDALAVAQTHANVYLEMSHVLAYFKDTSLEKDFAFAMNRMDRKLIHGSDFPEYHIDRYLALVRDMSSVFIDFEAQGFMGETFNRLISGESQQD